MLSSNSKEADMQATTCEVCKAHVMTGEHKGGGAATLEEVASGGTHWIGTRGAYPAPVPANLRHYRAHHCAPVEPAWHEEAAVEAATEDRETPEETPKPRAKKRLFGK